MASIILKSPADPVEVDGLCPICLLPSLRRYKWQQLDLDGITPLGERILCPQCKKWIGPMVPYEND